MSLNLAHVFTFNFKNTTFHLVSTLSFLASALLLVEKEKEIGHMKLA